MCVWAKIINFYTMYIEMRRFKIISWSYNKSNNSRQKKTATKLKIKLQISQLLFFIFFLFSLCLLSKMLFMWKQEIKKFQDEKLFHVYLNFYLIPSQIWCDLLSTVKAEYFCFFINKKDMLHKIQFDLQCNYFLLSSQLNILILL